MSLHASVVRIDQRRGELTNLLGSVPLDYNVDDEIEDVIKAEQALAAPRFQVSEYDVSNNLGDVADILDQLLSLRRELNNLEADRVRTALDYMSSRDLANLDYQVELEKHAPASGALQAALDAKRQTFLTSLVEMEERHSRSGSALNYSERILRLRAQLRIAVRSGHWRSRALDWSLRLGAPYPVHLAMPTIGSIAYADFKEARYLDDWCAWHRAMLQDIENHARNERTIEVSLSLGQREQIFTSRTVNTAATQDNPLIADLAGSLNRGGPLKFNLLPGHLSPQLNRHHRLLAFGLSAAFKANTETGWRFSCSVLIPGETTTVRVVDVGPLAQGVTWFSGSDVSNRNPAGPWEIDFDKLPLKVGDQNDHDREDRTKWPLLDIYLHLRLASV